jgi:hypothetical protein
LILGGATAHEHQGGEKGEGTVHRHPFGFVKKDVCLFTLLQLVNINK